VNMSDSISGPLYRALIPNISDLLPDIQIQFFSTLCSVDLQSTACWFYIYTRCLRKLATLLT